MARRRKIRLLFSLPGVIETDSKTFQIGIENRLREEVRKNVCKFWLKALTPEQLKGEGGETGRKTGENPNTAGLTPQGSRSFAKRRDQTEMVKRETMTWQLAGIIQQKESRLPVLCL